MLLCMADGGLIMFHSITDEQFSGCNSECIRQCDALEDRPAESQQILWGHTILLPNGSQYLQAGLAERDPDLSSLCGGGLLCRIHSGDI